MAHGCGLANFRSAALNVLCCSENGNVIHLRIHVDHLVCQIGINNIFQTRKKMPLEQKQKHTFWWARLLEWSPLYLLLRGIRFKFRV